MRSLTPVFVPSDHAIFPPAMPDPSKPHARDSLSAPSGTPREGGPPPPRRGSNQEYPPPPPPPKPGPPPPSPPQAAGEGACRSQAEEPVVERPLHFGSGRAGR